MDNEPLARSWFWQGNMGSRIAKFLKAVIGGIADYIFWGVMLGANTPYERRLGIAVMIGLAGLIAYLWITRGL